jgi:hypothetical protein
MYYYSVSAQEMELLSMEELAKMNQALNIFISQDVLTQFKISSFPHMEKKDKEKLHKDYHKMANPFLWENQSRQLSLRDIAAALGGANRG